MSGLFALVYVVTAIASAALFYLGFIAQHEREFPRAGTDNTDRVFATVLGLLLGGVWPLTWFVIGVALAFRRLERYVKKLRALQEPPPPGIDLSKEGSRG